MSLFEKKQSVVLQNATTSALNVFKSTISKLNDVVKQAQASITENSKLINDLTEENRKLDSIVENNILIASKLQDLFNPKHE